MRFRQRLATAFLLCSSLAGPALADATSEALVRSFIEHVDKSAEWQASSSAIRSEGSVTIVEGLKIGREDGEFSAAIATTSLNGLALREGGSLSLPAFTFSGVKLDGKTWSLTVPDVKGKDLVSPSYAGWSYDPKAPVTSVARFYTLLAGTEFSEIFIPSAGFAQTITMPNGPQTKSAVTYTDFRLGKLSGGVLAEQTVARMEQATTTGSGPAVTTLMDGIKARNTDLGAFARIIDPDAYAGATTDREWKDGVESAEYGRISSTRNGKEIFSIGPVTMGKLQVRQPELPFAPAIDRLIAMGDKPPEAEVISFFENHASSMVNWFRLTSLSIRDLKATPPEGGTITFSDISLEDASADGLKRFAMTGFMADAPEFRAGLKSFEIGDITWPSFKAFVPFMRLEESKKQGAPDIAAAQAAAASFMEVIPKIGRLSLSGLEAGLPGSDPVTLESYEAKLSGKYAMLPEDAKASLKNLMIPRGVLTATPESREVFDALGYNELVLNMDGKGTYAETTGAYSTESKIAVTDAGSLNLAYALGALTPDRLKQALTPILMAKPDEEPNPLLMIAALGPMSIDGFTLRFEDASLTRRLLSFAAKMQGTDEQTLIGNIGAMVQLGLSQLKQPELTAQAVAAVNSFLANPKSITISLKPQKPVTIQELMMLDPNNPGAALGLLGATVSAND
jgi:hypothetical protein